MPWEAALCGSEFLAVGVPPDLLLLLLPYVGHCAASFVAPELPSRLLVLVLHLQPLDAPVQLARFCLLVVVVALVLVVVPSDTCSNLKTQAQASTPASRFSVSKPFPSFRLPPRCQRPSPLPRAMQAHHA